jgi:signal peptidase I
MAAKGKVKKAPPLPDEVIRQRISRLYDIADIKTFFTRLVMVGAVVYVLFWVVFGLTVVRDNDMFPRLSSGDLLIYYRLQDAIHNQDLVVFEKDGQQYVGRVVARGGDIVEVTQDAELKVNDSFVWEGDIFYDTPQYEGGIIYPVHLADNEYFVLCDYRRGGKDSRYFGPVCEAELLGKVITVIRRNGL